MPQCSIIIPVRNRASVTRQVLNTLLGQRAQATDTEITVVDDASDDLTPRLLDSYCPRIQIVRHGSNTGFAVACNHGAMTASGEYLVFLNNDTIPQRGWLDALVNCARRHPKAGIVGAKLLFPNDTIQHAGVVFTQPIGGPTHIYFRFPADHPAVNKPRRFQAVTGACLLIRRALFEELGGFDPVFWNIYEDVDLCLRAGERGYEVRYCPQSVVYHLQSMTRSQSDAMKGTAHAIDHLRSRWLDRVERDELRYYEEDGLLSLAGDVDYPRRLTVSPLLATLDASTNAPLVDELITARGHQGGDVLSANIQLDLRMKDLELRVLAGAMGDSGAVPLPLTWPALRTRTPLVTLRRAIAGLYLEGAGVEIGALHSPVEVTPPVSVRYIDRMSVADLRRQYPELDGLPLVEPDILDDGERLTTLGDASQDFAIASHFLEHCQDPIGAVKTMLRVVRPGGIVFLAVPDKRYTFDRKRPVTSLDHVIRDYEEGPEWSRVAHFEEWVTLAEDVNIRGRTARELMDFDYSIHFHVWTQTELLELFAAMKTRFAFDFDIEAVVKNEIEVIVILRKGAA